MEGEVCKGDQERKIRDWHFGVAIVLLGATDNLFRKPFSTFALESDRRGVHALGLALSLDDGSGVEKF
jgi:hypothetical protein